MNKKSYTVFAALLVVILGAAVLYSLRQSEPSYQGRSLESWLNDMQNWDGDTNAPACIAFRAMGTNAIPELLDVLQSGSGRVEQMILAINRKQTFIQLPGGQPWIESTAATFALYSMGPMARPAMPVLSNLLFHSNETTGSATALAGIGPDALPILISALTNQSFRIRVGAALGLGWERCGLDRVIPALVRCLNDREPTVEHTAVISLGQLCIKPELCIPALMGRYQHTDLLGRRLILTTLGQFGHSATNAIPMILDALKDKNPDVQQAARFAIGRIDPQAAPKAAAQ